MTECILTKLPDGCISCSVCGWKSKKPVKAEIGRIHRECDTHRSVEVVGSLSLVCLACEYHRLHYKSGVRCTHKNCRCSKNEQELVEISGVLFNGGLAYRLAHGHCPAGNF